MSLYALPARTTEPAVDLWNSTDIREDGDPGLGSPRIEQLSQADAEALYEALGKLQLLEALYEAVGELLDSGALSEDLAEFIDSLEEALVQLSLTCLRCPSHAFRSGLCVEHYYDD